MASHCDDQSFSLRDVKFSFTAKRNFIDIPFPRLCDSLIFHRSIFPDNIFNLLGLGNKKWGGGSKKVLSEAVFLVVCDPSMNKL